MDGVCTGQDGELLPQEPRFQAATINLNQALASGSVQTILDLIDYNARVNPDACFCIQAHEPGSHQPQDDTHVTMHQLRAAIWRCSRDLRAHLIGIQSTDNNAGPNEEAVVKPYPVALFMYSDLTLLVYLFSLMALGVPVALLSIRLSPVSIQHILTVVKAQAVITSPLLISKVKQAFGTTSSVYGMGASKIYAATLFETFFTP